MGRKGGGRSGFIKSSQRAGDKDDTNLPSEGLIATEKEEQSAEKVIDAVNSVPAHPAVDEKRAGDAVTNVESNDNEEDDAEDRETSKNGNVETRGQMVQRHKRETKALKEKIKRMGKKAKDEAARLESEMQQRHVAELASHDASEAILKNDTSVLDTLPKAFYAVTVDDGEGSNDAAFAASVGNKKPSKAQKRREQRAREEAEREARIAAELAEIGETEREVEEKELQLLLSPHGLGIKDIPPDGHCLYRSIEDQLEQLGVKLENSSFMSLRQLAADHLRQHADHFRPFVIGEDEESSKDAPDGETLEINDPFEAYCHKIEATAAWGGHVEIQALSQALKAHVRVYSVGLPALDIGKEFSESGPTLQVCYLKHAYGLGEHYNSVRPIANGGRGDEC